MKKNSICFALLLFVLTPLAEIFPQALVSSDTLSVKERCVIFWQMTMTEYDAAFETYPEKLDSLFYEFNLNIGNLTPYLNKNGLKFIRFEGLYLGFNSATAPLILTRSELGSPYGVILADNLKAPYIIKGVNKNSVILKAIKEYFYK